MTTSPQPQFNKIQSTLHMAIELSASTWKLGFADVPGRRPRVRSVEAGDFVKLRSEISAAKKAYKFG